MYAFGIGDVAMLLSVRRTPLPVAAGTDSIIARVAESRFSPMRLRTRYGTGVIADGAVVGHVAVSVIAILRLGERVHFLGDVDSSGAPGDTPSTAHASGAAELIVPGAELVGDPVPVP